MDDKVEKEVGAEKSLDELKAWSQRHADFLDQFRRRLNREGALAPGPVHPGGDCRTALT